MGFFGGSAQATNHNQANILFNPQINVGDGSTTSTPEFNPVSTTSPKLDDSTTASVGAALAPGSTASGGPIQKSSDEPYYLDQKNEKTYMPTSNKKGLDKYLPYALLGGGGLLLYNTLVTKKAS